MNAPDTRIAEIAARQHGLVRTSDLRAAGLSSSAVSKRRARGLLHRVHRGVYAVGHAALASHALWLAAVFAAGEGAALCGLAAAELWGLRRAKGSITVVAPRQVRVAGVLVRRCNRLDPRDVTVRNGIPVTTVARTIVDLAEILTVEQLANVMYEAAYLGLLDIEAVEATAARLIGRRGLATLEEAIDAHRKGSAGTKSEKEDTFHALIKGRLPKPIANVKVLGHESTRSGPTAGSSPRSMGLVTDGLAPAVGMHSATSSFAPPATRSSASPTRRSKSGLRRWFRR